MLKKVFTAQIYANTASNRLHLSFAFSIDLVKSLRFYRQVVAYKQIKLTLHTFPITI